MNNQLTIPAQPVYAPAMNYEWLRQQGLKHIETLGHDLWTDYNAHDPGITILELFSYAITDLGYRTGFSIPDLISGKAGQYAAPMFTARNILTTHPVRVKDYRKLLIDIPGVQNVWLLAAETAETEFYADLKKEVLTFTPDPDFKKVYVRGLYRILLELEQDAVLGDLNKGNIVHFINKGFLKGGIIDFILPNWDEHKLDKIIDASPVVTDIDFNLQKRKGTCFLKITGIGDVSVSFNLLKENGITAATVALLKEYFSNNGFKAMLEVLEEYRSKMKLARAIVAQVKQNMESHRNLCEDVLSISPVPPTYLGFCADIEVTNDADIEEVYAEIATQIEAYLNPTPTFYSLKELMDKKVPVEDIFNGPPLQHGFMLDSDLHELRCTIYMSDLINIIMDIPGVIAIKLPSMTLYNKLDQVISTKGAWSIKIPKGHLSHFSPEASKIKFFKDGLPFLPKTAETYETIQYINHNKNRIRWQNTELDLITLPGDDRELANYLALRFDMPQCYGVGFAGTSEMDSPEKRAQALQLKGYLAFFDQVLADYLAQLNNTGSMLSTADIATTQFSQFINEQYPEDYNAAMAGYPYLYDLALPNILADNPANPTVKKQRQQLLEQPDAFSKRRNAFLDHLLARFAEQFNDYVLLLYKDQRFSEGDLESRSKLISVKAKLLDDYPEISANRSHAYNYLPLKEDSTIDDSRLWDTDNVSGLERRLYRILGLDDLGNKFRRTLFCIRAIDIKQDPDDNLFYLIIQNENGTEWFRSPKGYTQLANAELDRRDVSALLDNTGNYVIRKGAGDTFNISVSNDTETLLLTSNEAFTSEADAKKAIKKYALIFAKDCENEGLHLIEHTLLRPISDDPVYESSFRFLSTCLDKACGDCGEKDPYSFRVSIIFPYSAGRFDSLEFRRYAEQIIRMEVPAHIVARICWISNGQMYELEQAYKMWLKALAMYKQTSSSTNRDALLTANNQMTDILNNLKSVYPVATLHDCDEGSDFNPVQLNKTILGTN